MTDKKSMSQLQALEALVAAVGSVIGIKPFAGSKDQLAEAVIVAVELLSKVKKLEKAPGGVTAAALEVLKEHGLVVTGMAKADSPASPFIRRFLDLSTGHLTSATRGALSEKEMNIPQAPEWTFSVVATADPYGWWVWSGLDLHGFEGPEDFRAVIVYARTRGCDWIKLDCDAQILPDLPYYDEDD